MASVRGAGKGVTVVIGTDYNNADLKRAQRDLDALKREAQMTATPMQKLGSTLKSALVPGLAAAGAAAGYMALRLGVDAVKGALEEQKAIAQLRTTLDNLGLAMQMPEIEAFIDNLQFATGVADDELRPAFQRLVRATGDVAKSQRLLQLALDISASTGRDLGSVSAALSKAAGGQTSALTRLGVTLSASAKKTGNFSLAVDELTAKFQGSAAAAADTYQGQINRLTVAFGELQDSFGTGFLQGLMDANGATDNLTQSMKDNQQAAQDMGRSIGEIARALGTLAGYYSGFMDFVDRVKQFFAVVGGPLSAVGIMGPIGDVVEGFQQIRSQMQGTENAAQSVADETQKMSMRMRSDINGITTAAQRASAGIRGLESSWGSGMSGSGLPSSLGGTIGGRTGPAMPMRRTPTSKPKKPNYFREFVVGLKDDAARASIESRLVGRGFPADLARAVTNAPGWKAVSRNLLDANRKALRAYVRLYKRSPEAREAARQVAEMADQAAADARRAQQQRARDAAKRVADEVRTFTAAIKDQFAGLAATVRDFGSLTTFAPDEGMPVTARGITANLRQRLAVVRQFNAAMAELKRLRLRPQARADIFALGPLDGLKYAQAIVAGGRQAVGEINALTDQFNAPAVAGRFAALGVEAQTGAQAAALGGATAVQVQAGAIQITVNGSVTALQRKEIEDAVRRGINGIGREARSSRKAGIR